MTWHLWANSKSFLLFFKSVVCCMTVHLQKKTEDILFVVLKNRRKMIMLTFAHVGVAVGGRCADGIHEVRLGIRDDVVTVAELGVFGARLHLLELIDAAQLRQVEHLDTNVEELHHTRFVLHSGSSTGISQTLPAWRNPPKVGQIWQKKLELDPRFESFGKSHRRGSWMCSSDCCVKVMQANCMTSFLILAVCKTKNQTHLHAVIGSLRDDVHVVANNLCVSPVAWARSENKPK